MKKIKIRIFYLAAIPMLTYFLTIVFFSFSSPNIEWDWQSINLEDTSFPSRFAWGTATAAHQVEGGNTNNNWYQWEQGYDQNKIPRIYKGQKSGLAVDHWNRYPEDIKLMKDLGVSHYRFSVEWSKIEPRKGFFDQQVLEHYRKMTEALVASGITPVITLHHFSHPIWFENLGAFEKEDNIQYFINFSKIVFNALSDLIPIWCTINEPSVFVSEGYFNGIFPPGKKDPVLAGIVMKNLLNAHVEVYRVLKKLPNGEFVKIGMVKSIFQFDPLRRWHIGDWIISHILNNVFNNAPLDFLKTGKSVFYMPGTVNQKLFNANAPLSLDFIGLNYYSRFHVEGRLDLQEPFTIKTRKNDAQTDMGYPIYAEGIYRALKTIQMLKVPIFITENGLADRSDNMRAIFIKRYLYAVSRAIDHGLDIRGYFYWTLMDNFEWAKGYDMKFGLYEVDFNTQKRTLREGSKAFMEIINRPNPE